MTKHNNLDCFLFGLLSGAIPGLVMVYSDSRDKATPTTIPASLTAVTRPPTVRAGGDGRAIEHAFDKAAGAGNKIIPHVVGASPVTPAAQNRGQYPALNERHTGRTDTSPLVLAVENHTAPGARHGSPSGSSPGADIFDQAVDYIHKRESDYGRDPKAKRGIVGAAGERGAYQITPVFERDIRRLFGVEIDPYDTDALRKYIPLWLAHYRPTTTSVAELYRIYNEGP
jgi:hypothetical protein